MIKWAEELMERKEFFAVSITPDKAGPVESHALEFSDQVAASAFIHKSLRAGVRVNTLGPKTLWLRGVCMRTEFEGVLPTWKCETGCVA